MNKKKILNIVIIVLVIVLVIGGIVLNIFAFEKKNNKPIEKTTETTTTTEASGITSEDTHPAYVIIEGETEEFQAKTYTSHLGFTVDYDEAYFTPSVLSNSTVMLTNIYDENIYIKIEKMSQENYYDSYENKESSFIDGDYQTTYTYLRGNGVYFRIEKHIVLDPEYDGLGIRMDYYINTVNIV